MESQIYSLVRLYCATLAEQPANRVLSEIAKVANLGVKLPITDKDSRHSVLVWVDTNYPGAYTEACKNPLPGGWIFDVATIEAKLAQF